ncbi:MAG: glycosyltransferase family 4 protein [Candidatus Bathyarchaeia archaeon]
MLYISSFPLPHFGGMSNVFFEEIEWLTKEGVEVKAICEWPEKGAPEAPPGVMLERYRYYFRKPIIGKLVEMVFRIPQVRRALRTGDFDACHAHDAYAALYCALAGYSKKTVLTLHSILSLDPFIMGRGYHGRSPWEKLMLILNFLIDRLIEILTYNLVRAIICVSEWEEERIRGLVLNKGRVFILRNGIDTAKFRPSEELKNKARERLGVKGDEAVCLFIGRMVPKEGPLTVARASVQVLREFDRAVFVFVGDGPERDRCERLIEAQGLSHRAKFLGGIDAREVIHAGDISIKSVSSLVDGIGLAALESMACGIPTILGRDKITGKLFRDGEALLVRKDDPEDLARAIGLLISDEGMRASIGAKGRRKVEEEFSIERRIERLKHILFPIE